MLAWRAHANGEPWDVLRLDEVEPVPCGPGDVRIEVHAAALNYPDILMCRGNYQERPEHPFTPGMEVAGVVVDADGTSEVREGQRVLAVTSLPNGGLAEYVRVRAEDAHPIPERLGFDAAAAMPITYQTGYYALRSRADLQPGETLLVHGGSGGVGSAAIQLGRAFGARVVATATGADKARTCAELGADTVIDLEREELIDTVKGLTGGRGADVIFDPVGGDLTHASRRCVAFEGRLLVIGFVAGEIPQAPLNHVLVKNYSLVGVHWGLFRRLRPTGVRAIHDALMELWERGAIDPLISRRLELAEVPEGLRLIAERRSQGKLVVTRTTPQGGQEAS